MSTCTAAEHCRIPTSNSPFPRVPRSKPCSAIESGGWRRRRRRNAVSYRKIYGKRIIVMGGGAQVGQVALGAITEADRHNIRGERISVDTIPLVGEQELAAAFAR